MCDEYDDARMKAFWRALAEAQAEENEIEAPDEESVVKPLVIEPLAPTKHDPKALVR